MRIVALDLSLTGTGVCLPDGETRTIRTKLMGMPRIVRIWHDLQLLLSSAYPVDLVVLEGYSFHSKGNAGVSLGELGGIIRWELLDLWPYVEIPPSCRAKYATGKGNAPKDLVLQEAVHRSGRVFGDNNQADAFWLHQMALAHYEPESPLLVKVPAINREGLSGVKWAEPGRRPA